MLRYGDRISVIMACYNSAETINYAIDSIIHQTYQNWIMICCDDGSTDNTFQILEDYKKSYPEKFLLLRNETNKQLPYSLNRCLKHVTDEVVARMDADDWSDPKRFEKQIKYLIDHPDIDLVGTGVTISNGQKVIGTIIKKEYPTKESMLKQNAFSHATIMTYKRVYDALGGYSEEPYVIRVEDVDLWCRFLAAGYKGYNIPDLLYTILENESAIKRRTFRARLNSAKTRQRGYRLMGFTGWRCYYPYIRVIKSIVPNRIYKFIYRIRHK